MSIVANVSHITGKTRHRVVTREAIYDVPAIVRVRIEPSNGAFYLFRFDASGAMVADTWHQTEDEAKAQAKWEYEIDEDAWAVALDRDHNGPHNPGAVRTI